MTTFLNQLWRGIGRGALAILLFYGTGVTIAVAASASLSTSTVNISTGETGSWTISGDDSGSQREFRWSLPSGLTVTTGSSSNMYRFRVRSDRGYLQVRTDGRGRFSATVNVSSNTGGSYVMQNLRADIALSPRDVTINVGGSTGGGGTGGGSTGGGSTGGGSTGGGSANYTLYIETGQVNITASPDSGNGATSLPVWGYTTANGGNGRVPGPIIEMVEGQTITVEVVNNHNRSHNFVVQGMTSDSTAISPNSRYTYTLTANRSGVFLYHDTLNGGVNQALGLFGAVIVRPSAGSTRAWSTAPSADQERLWVITDMDVPRWNNVANGGGTVNTGTYRPNYFLMNGKNGFQAMGDPDTNLEGSVGELFLVRIVNAGQYDQSLHFHSNHFRIISVNGNRLGQFEWGDTINVKGGTTAMVLYQLNQPGHYPMHVHTAQMETGNGVYLNGTAAMIIAH
ncbi:MAG: multicopper oxidase domain-containing protein [Gammaproteobacteria bacterium]|nr:multicopper oxidase domain-containing protein [Gammaproteobacteria bacterium]MDH5653740.1 multicopper oxidase domain-containing protein [Gammaproteobacteria bacterium]